MQYDSSHIEYYVHHFANRIICIHDITEIFQQKWLLVQTQLSNCQSSVEITRNTCAENPSDKNVHDVAHLLSNKIMLSTMSKT